MKCLYVVFMFFAYNYVIWGQNIAFPDEAYVSGDNFTVTNYISDKCPQNMVPYIIDSTTNESVCDCGPRFLYFPLNDSCYEAYRQGPCPPKNYFVLPENETTATCVENPCLIDGRVWYNDTCYPLRAKGGPCGPMGIISVNATTFQLECEPANVAPFYIIDGPPRENPPGPCPHGTRRSTLGACKPV